MACKHCGAEKVHARGFCSKCYARYLANGSPERVRVKNTTPCTHCGEKPQRTRGLCEPCYKRFRQHGTPDRVKVRATGECSYCGVLGALNQGLCLTCYHRKWKKGTPEYETPLYLLPCTSCGGPSQKAHGLCSKCYTRLRKHGDPTKGNPERWGQAEKHPLYRTWGGILKRCSDPNCKSYKYYGGRGIDVCERWKTFWNFADDMGVKPSPIHSIDRIDNERGYSPENCKWSTPKEQANNRSNNLNRQGGGGKTPLPLAQGGQSWQPKAT